MITDHFNEFISPFTVRVLVDNEIEQRTNTDACSLQPCFSNLFGAHGSPSPGSLLNLCPRFYFIVVASMAYLFVLCESLTS